MLTARRLSIEVNWPLTRRLTVSGPACTMPDGATAFCCCRLFRTACWSMPSPAIWRVEKLRWIDLVLHAQQLDLAGAGKLQDLAARLLGIVAQLRNESPSAVRA